MFRIGQRVVCIDDSMVPYGASFRDKDGKQCYSTGDLGGLRLGCVYTIARINRGVLCDTFELLEIARRATNDDGYWSRRFRPAVERKTDISIFTAMLTPKRQHETSPL